MEPAPRISERARLDSEMLSRWLMGLTIKKQLSIDLLDSVIYAFSPDRRFRLQIELAARQGMITFPVSSSNASVDALFLGRIAKEVGDVLIAGAGLLEDGVIDSRDRVKAPEFLVQVDEAIAVLFAVKEHASRAALGKSAVVDFAAKAQAG